MAKKGGGGGGQREGNVLRTAVVVTGGLVLAWITMESAFKPFLDRLRASVTRTTEPARDPDEEPAAPPAPAVDEDKDSAAAEPSAPPLPAEVADGGEKKGEDEGGATAE
ncbi:hypothetical protein GUJ93_ZPchr0006g45198 [Zizania palustris]|uniref:Outer envelope membrane protein 7 n=1 Tax=Zizania palustris TaxID=103762 RepID=A0A8J5T1J9_ZIZPA|nr:hypothetical protein GUJ93_ZPchr0006g45198 [Zizania palustris]